jgi:hypothetical protein
MISRRDFLQSIILIFTSVILTSCVFRNIPIESPTPTYPMFTIVDEVEYWDTAMALATDTWKDAVIREIAINAYKSYQIRSSDDMAVVYRFTSTSHIATELIVSCINNSCSLSTFDYRNNGKALQCKPFSQSDVRLSGSDAFNQSVAIATLKDVERIDLYLSRGANSCSDELLWEITLFKLTKPTIQIRIDAFTGEMSTHP